ncbi:hypothetical protein CEUSTIGMA_g5412.t1 [Chlamydomonas eustigma]|uniref:Uncharacterized protein n=1 Tax=Chlamydomonas eustigma TaxID=1157962 RepID=A0A250X5D7_9CHLO|nr:hypothetical protein CEUSTIGMA_g5412.t1 [Chlamydomonas eustigma]|eukprot:GAX77970.1 hypothetical protein CEUSTIGMA_g5412.t1 [Chlamydomonas eustigma]
MKSSDKSTSADVSSKPTGISVKGTSQAAAVKKGASTAPKLTASTSKASRSTNKVASNSSGAAGSTSKKTVSSSNISRKATHGNNKVGGASSSSSGVTTKVAAVKDVKNDGAADDIVNKHEMSEEEARLKQEALERTQAEMEVLRKAAWQAQVDYERKQEAKRRKKSEDELRRKKEEASLTKALLEAAFDGEDDEVSKLLLKANNIILKGVDCCDVHGNTLLSEAAAGGHVSTVQLLIERGADPNSKGEFGRTPLWRAAFLGNLDVITPLLIAGADPRLSNEQGELPSHVASKPEIKDCLLNWDLSVTDELVLKWRAREEQRKLEAAAHFAAEVKSAEEQVAAAKEENDKAQKALKHARTATLSQIHIAESTVETAKRRAHEARERLDSAKLALRERQSEEREAEGGTEGYLSSEGCELVAGVPVGIKELDDVLVRDVGNKIKSDGRWPLIIDPSGQASVFLRYLDTNYVNALSSNNLEPNRLRRSILGAVRYGKPVVLDLMDCDVLWEEMPKIFDSVQPGLLSSILDKSLITTDKYLALTRQEDGEEYEPNKFQECRISAFKFILLTTESQPNEEMTEKFYSLRVLVKA